MFRRLRIIHELKFSKKEMKLFLVGNVVSAVTAIPTVMWHGMGDHGNSGGMNRLKNLIIDNTSPDNYVLSLVIGESKS